MVAAAAYLMLGHDGRLVSKVMEDAGGTGVDHTKSSRRAT